MKRNLIVNGLIRLKRKLRVRSRFMYFWRTSIVRRLHNIIPLYYKSFKKVLILEPAFPGLGDHLFFSHIPRLAKQSGKYKKILVSERCHYNGPDIKRLVWELNPYVDGFTKKHGIKIGKIPSGRVGYNLLDEKMIYFDLDDGLRLHEPEVYYQPRIKPELAGKNLYDPNCISRGADNINLSDIESYLANHGVKIDYQMSPRNKSLVLSDVNNFLSSRDLFDFCDILSSCDKLYCLMTGTEVLAAALKKSATVFATASVISGFGHSPLHHYIEISQM